MNILIVGQRTRERSEFVKGILMEESKHYSNIHDGGIEIRTKLLVNEEGESTKFKIFEADLDNICDNIKQSTLI